MLVTVPMVLLFSCLSMTIMGLLLVHFAKKHQGHVAGVSEMGFALLVAVAAQLIFIATTDTSNTSAFLMPLGLCAVLASLMLANQSIRRFFQQKPRHSKLSLAVFLVSFLGVLVWFSFKTNHPGDLVAINALYGMVVLIDMIVVLVRFRQHSSGVSLLIIAVCVLIVIRLLRIYRVVFENTPIGVSDFIAPIAFNFFLLTLPILLAPTVTIGFLVMTSDKLIKRLRDSARLDPLTGVLNKATMSQEMARELNRSIRYRRPLSVLMIDLDNFKMINDTQGHLKGDELLKETVKWIAQSLRETDSIARFGGDEFTALLLETDDEGALLVAQRIVDKLNQNLPSDCSASVGIATLQDSSDTVTSITERADRALYQAKRLGKNQVFINRTPTNGDLEHDAAMLNGALSNPTEVELSN